MFLIDLWEGWLRQIRWIFGKIPKGPSNPPICFILCTLLFNVRNMVKAEMCVYPKSALTVAFGQEKIFYLGNPLFAFVVLCMTIIFAFGPFWARAVETPVTIFSLKIFTWPHSGTLCVVNSSCVHSTLAFRAEKHSWGSHIFLHVAFIQTCIPTSH